MRIILLITVLESSVVALLLVLWRFRSAYSKMPAGEPVWPIISATNNQTAETMRRAATEDSRWAFINGWKVEPQGDDRMPVFGGVAASTASPSGRRSMARRRHQAMYKVWSQERHD
jgi:hypothetical protein